MALARIASRSRLDCYTVGKGYRVFAPNYIYLRLITYKDMKKIIVPAVSLLFILLSFTSGVSAQTELLFGQNHFYTVIFRGNGEGITYAKIAITNPDEKTFTEVFFLVPKVFLTEIV